MPWFFPFRLKRPSTHATSHGHRGEPSFTRGGATRRAIGLARRREARAWAPARRLPQGTQEPTTHENPVSDFSRGIVWPQRPPGRVLFCGADRAAGAAKNPPLPPRPPHPPRPPPSIRNCGPRSTRVIRARSSRGCAICSAPTPPRPTLCRSRGCGRSSAGCRPSNSIWRSPSRRISTASATRPTTPPGRSPPRSQSVATGSSAPRSPPCFRPPSLRNTICAAATPAGACAASRSTGSSTPADCRVRRTRAGGTRRRSSCSRSLRRSSVRSARRDYERAIDYHYQRTGQLVARLELPAETTRRLWDVQQDFQKRRSETYARGGGGVPTPALAAALTALQQQAVAAVTPLLGNASRVEASKQYGGARIDYMVPRPTTPPPK
jgi:hypothetical protein